MHASNFPLPPLDLVLVDFETLILMETKSGVYFTMYTMVKVHSRGGFLGDLSIILLGEL
jgi:hypothetical protein